LSYCGATCWATLAQTKDQLADAPPPTVQSNNYVFRLYKVGYDYTLLNCSLAVRWHLTLEFNVGIELRARKIPSTQFLLVLLIY